MHLFTERFTEPFTEPFTSHSLGEGKGREGKGKQHFYSPSIHSVTYVTRAEAAPSVAPSPPTPSDGMDGLTIPLTDLPSLDGEVPCEVEPWSPEHPADLIIRVCCLPVAICRVGYDAAMGGPLGICRCERCGKHFRDGRTAMRIVQVLR